jgi:L-ascorbate metabolism protein UlaG (beta-lactamase superfamily)
LHSNIERKTDEYDRQKKSLTLIHDIEAQNPDKGSAYLWFLGGSSFTIKFHDQPLIFTDLDAYTHLERPGEIPPSGLAPGLSLVRKSFLPFAPEEITQRAAYVSSHEHKDHCDRGSLLPIIEKGGVLIGPKSSCELAKSWGVPQEQIVRLDGERFEKAKFGEIDVCAAPGRDSNAISSNIHLFCYDGICILHNGDSLYDGPNYLGIADHFKKIDVALINLGKNSQGRSWYHTPYDVVRAGNDLQPRFLVCHHYDKWEVLVEDPERVASAIETSYPELSRKTQFRILKNGERFDISA